MTDGGYVTAALAGREEQAKDPRVRSSRTGVRSREPGRRASSSSRTFVSSGPSLARRARASVTVQDASSSDSRTASSSSSMSRNSLESNTSPQARHSTYSTSSSRATTRTFECLQGVSIGELIAGLDALGKIVPAGIPLSNPFPQFPAGRRGDGRGARDRPCSHPRFPRFPRPNPGPFSGADSRLAARIRRGGLAQYLGTLGSTCSLQAWMPPARFRTF